MTKVPSNWVGLGTTINVGGRHTMGPANHRLMQLARPHLKPMSSHSSRFRQGHESM